MKNKHLYPENWNDVIRPEILKRDQYKCSKCTAPHRATGYYNSQGVFINCDQFMINWCKANGQKVNKIYLQIAHLNHDKADCRPENLKAMCPRCHLEYDRPMNMLKRKLPGRQQPKQF